MPAVSSSAAWASGSVSSRPPAWSPDPMAEKKLTLTVTLAASLVGLAGCSDNDARGYRATGNTRVCADDWGQRIADDYCERRGGGGSFFYLGRGAPIPYYYDNLNDRRYAGYV